MCVIYVCLKHKMVYELRIFFFSSRRRHTRCALVTGVQTCALPILLTFAIVGGGPTGVELAGTLAEIARHTLKREFRNIESREARVLLLEEIGSAACRERVCQYV